MTAPRRSSSSSTRTGTRSAPPPRPTVHHAEHAAAPGVLLLRLRRRRARCWSPGGRCTSRPGRACGPTASAATRRRVRTSPTRCAARGAQELGLTLEDLQLALPAFRYEATMANGVRENELCPVFTAVARRRARSRPGRGGASAWVAVAVVPRRGARRRAGRLAVVRTAGDRAGDRGGGAGPIYDCVPEPPADHRDTMMCPPKGRIADWGRVHLGSAVVQGLRRLRGSAPVLHRVPRPRPQRRTSTRPYGELTPASLKRQQTAWGRALSVASKNRAVGSKLTGMHSARRYCRRRACNRKCASQGQAEPVASARRRSGRSIGWSPATQRTRADDWAMGRVQ